MGINFAQASWPAVASITPGSLADTAHPHLVAGAVLHSIGAGDGAAVALQILQQANPQLFA